jgi:hypothetical protein
MSIERKGRSLALPERVDPSKSMRDYYVVVPEDGVAVRGRMRHLHEASLETMGMYFATVTPSKTILEVWSRRIT